MIRLHDPTGAGQADRHLFRCSAAVLGAAAAANLLCAGLAAATDFKFDDPALSLTWDNTLKYSNAFRVRGASDPLLADANQDDGNRNFKRGLASNRLDLFSEADLNHRDVGLRVSAAAWYDTAYNRSNANDSPGTSNNVSVPANQFTRDTRNVAGRKAELLDAFVLVKADIAGAPVKVRVGRHALQWGESLFFGNNGIAGAMAPLDIVKAAAVPNSLVREIIRPVGQVSATAELSPSVLLAGYYQYRWDKTRLPPAGSYFSAGDILDDGGECLRFASGVPCGTPGATLLRNADLKAKNSGQGGLRLKITDRPHGVDYGLYALRFHSKTPYVYFNATLQPIGPGGALVPAPSAYQLIYPENIRLYGASFTFTSGDYQWSGEASTRRHTPLNGAATAPLLPGTADNDKNPAYPVGNTAHAQLSLLATLPGSFVAKSATLLAEVAWNRTLSVTSNPQAVYPNASRDAVSLRAVYIPTYTQVLDGLDIDVPIGLSYSPKARSSAVPGFGTEHGGDISIGLSGTFVNVWKFGLTYQHFYGPAGVTQDAFGIATFKQALKDRDFVSFSLSKTF